MEESGKFSSSSAVLWLVLVCHSQGTAAVDSYQLKQLAPAPTIKEHIISHLHVFEDDSDFFMKKELHPFLVPRPSGSSKNSAVRNHIKSNMKALGWKVERDISNQLTVVGFKQFTNIIATLDPSATKRLVLACHYDSKLFPLGFVGAMGSAVPCAMMINLARRFDPILKMMKSPTTIQLVFFDGEEAFLLRSPIDSLYGSRNLAKVWSSKRDPNESSKNYLKNIEAFVLLDLIGHKDTNFRRYFKETDGLFTQLVEFETHLRDMGMLKRPNTSPPMFRNQRRPNAIDDDHVPFRKKGVKNIMHLITSPSPSTQHTMKDNIGSMDDAVIQDFNKIFGLFVTYTLFNSM